MSRNFELLQRAQRLLELKPRARDRISAALDEEVERQQHGDETRRGGGNGHHLTKPLPSSELVPEQRREILRLVSAVSQSLNGASTRLIAVGGIDRSAASAHITACAGELLAEHLGKRICVVDADLHDGKLHSCFGLTAEPGLSDAIAGDASPFSVCRQVSSKLWVVTVGSRASTDGLLMRDATRTCLEQLHDEFSCCLVVSPPMCSVEALPVVGVANSVLLVVDANATRRDTARGVKEMLTTSNVPLLGVVLNNRSFPVPEWLYERL